MCSTLGVHKHHSEAPIDSEHQDDVKIRCPDCNAEVPVKGESCPGCGKQIVKSEGSGMGTILVVLIVAAAVAALWLLRNGQS